MDCLHTLVKSTQSINYIQSWWMHEAGSAVQPAHVFLCWFSIWLSKMSWNHILVSAHLGSIYKEALIIWGSWLGVGCGVMSGVMNGLWGYVGFWDYELCYLKLLDKLSFRLNWMSVHASDLDDIKHYMQFGPPASLESELGQCLHIICLSANWHTRAVSHCAIYGDSNLRFSCNVLQRPCLCWELVGCPHQDFHKFSLSLAQKCVQGIFTSQIPNLAQNEPRSYSGKTSLDKQPGSCYQ